MALATQLKGQGITPFAVSDRGGWTMASVLFEDVLVAQAGADFYHAYLAGQKAPDAPEIQAALATVGQMLDMSNADAPTTSWSDAVAKVCMGQAAMLLLPDFVNAEFQRVGCGPAQVGYVPMQMAGESSFVFVSIAFVLPTGAAHPAAAELFLETVGSQQGQLAFCRPNGSIPARTDVNLAMAGYDSVSQQTYADYTAAGEKLVPAYAELTSVTFQAAINTALQAFSDRTNPAYKDAATMVAALKANYAQINHP
jgi:glucose/mannose transport system substrate-binding protein